MVDTSTCAAADPSSFSISPAATRVYEMHAMRCFGPSRSDRLITSLMCSTSQYVFPAPGPARIRKGVSTSSRRSSDVMCLASSRMLAPESEIEIEKFP